MDGIYEVVIGGHNGHGDYAENVFHYTISGTVAGSLAYETARDLLDELDTTAVFADMAAFQGSDCTLDVFSARRVDGPGGPTYQKGISIDGGATDESFSNVVAVDIASYPGGDANRVGHTYLWGIPISEIVSDVVQSGLLADIGTFLTALIASVTVNTGTAHLATYSKALNVATKVTDLVSRTKISGFSKRTSPVN